VRCCSFPWPFKSVARTVRSSTFSSAFLLNNYALEASPDYQAYLTRTYGELSVALMQGAVHAVNYKFRVVNRSYSPSSSAEEVFEVSPSVRLAASVVCLPTATSDRSGTNFILAVCDRHPLFLSPLFGYCDLIRVAHLRS